MAGRFEATVVVDRPIDEVFAFLANGENDPKFSPRVLEIAKTTDGPPGVGTVYASTVKDAGMKTKREFKLTEFEAPTRIRWAETSKNLVTAAEGGYDLAPEGSGTRVTHPQRPRGARFGQAARAAGAASRSARAPMTSGGPSRPPSRPPRPGRRTGREGRRPRRRTNARPGARTGHTRKRALTVAERLPVASFARAITRYWPARNPRLRALKDTEFAPVLPLRVSVVPSLEYRALCRGPCARMPGSPCRARSAGS